MRPDIHTAFIPAHYVRRQFGPSSRVPRTISAPALNALSLLSRLHATRAPCRSWCRDRACRHPRTEVLFATYRRLPRGFNGIGRHIDGPHHHLLAPNEFNQIHGNARVVTFQRDHVDTGFLQLGEGFLVLPPLRPQRLLPVRVGLDAIAIANMHGGFTLETFDRSFQGRDAPIIHLVEEDIECAIELNDIDAGSLQFPGFLVQDLCELPGQFSRLL